MITSRNSAGGATEFGMRCVWAALAFGSLALICGDSLAQESGPNKKKSVQEEVLDAVDAQDGTVRGAEARLCRVESEHLQAAGQLRENAAIRRAPGTNTRWITLQNLHPFVLGKRVLLEDVESNRLPRAKSLLLTFDLDDPYSRYSHSVAMTAEIDIERLDAPKMSNSQLLLTFLDARGTPIKGHYASLSIPDAAEQSAKQLVENLRKHNEPWLAPVHKSSFSYLYRGARISVDEKSSLIIRRGFALSTSFEDLLASPDEYRIPILFEGMLDGKPVVLAGFCGKTMNHVCGGTPAVGYGYMSFLNSMGSILFERDTWRPLVVRLKHWEIQYSDYVEIKPGVSAPTRIVFITDDKRNMCYDFRFKVLDGELWLLDGVYRDGEFVPSNEDVLWDNGKAATTTARSTEEGTDEFKPFDFRRVTDRKVSASRDSAALQAIMAQSRPWDCPGYADLMKTALSTGKDGGATIRMNLGPASFLKDAAFFSLTWLSPGGVATPIQGPEKAGVVAYLLPPGEAGKVTMPSSPHGSRGVRSVEIMRKGSSCEARAEFHETAQDVGLAAFLSLAIVDLRGIVHCTGHQIFRFTNFRGVYSSERLLHLRHGGGNQQLCLIPRYRSSITARRMGSGLAMVSDGHQKPPLTWKQIFSAEDSRVWGYGLQLLQSNVHFELRRYPRWRDCPPMALENDLRERVLAPHKQVLVRFLQTTEEAKWLVMLAQLAGHTGDRKFHDLLLPLLNHRDQEVREAAAVHLGRFDDARGLKLVLDVFQRELAEIPDQKQNYVSPDLVEALVAIHILDTDEAINVVGDSLLLWLQRSSSDRDFCSHCKKASEEVVSLMKAVLKRSQCPQAAEYLTLAVSNV